MEASEAVVDPAHGLARNALGLPQVLFCIVTGAAPIAAMLFNDPWAVYGGGWAAPSAFIIATVAFTVFSVGYVAMARRVTAAGGFYSFVSHGFGQSAGMGDGAADRRLLHHLRRRRDRRHGVLRELDDQRLVRRSTSRSGSSSSARSRVMLALAFFHIELTAKILGVFLMIELIALLVFGVAALFQPASTGSCFDVAAAVELLRRQRQRLEGGLRRRHASASGFFGAFWSWIGFEMAPNYAEESRDPKKIMGPATYISVIGLGVLYTFICWMLVVAWGKAGIIAGRQRAVQRRDRLGLLPADGPRLRPRHRQRVDC